MCRPATGVPGQTGNGLLQACFLAWFQTCFSSSVPQTQAPPAFNLPTSQIPNLGLKWRLGGGKNVGATVEELTFKGFNTIRFSKKCGKGHICHIKVLKLISLEIVHIRWVLSVEQELSADLGHMTALRSPSGERPWPLAKLRSSLFHERFKPENVLPLWLQHLTYTITWRMEMVLSEEALAG